jgi:signal transduction histidine kinase
MFQQLLNWRTLLALVAISIVTGTIFYSQYLARKIAKEERQKVELWVEAGQSVNSDANTDTRLASYIILQTRENKAIPIIQTNERDSIIETVNLDSVKSLDKKYIEKKLREFKSQNLPIIWTDPVDSTRHNRYYYGDSKLLNEVRYYPLVQLVIVGLFILITLLALRSSYRSTQNQVWAGMAKETAHQLGTPVSSLAGWVEVLKENPANEQVVADLQKDVARLQLVTDRFGKIGSIPQLERRNIVAQVSQMVDYMKKRTTGKINFILNTQGKNEINARVSGPLFDWVIENLLKNALDAMEGKGNIIVDIFNAGPKTVIDIIDTGKGISAQHISKVFKPGFTTKKRGWGLGLSLSKRIIEQFHKGRIYVRQSEPGKGTTFRIELHD